MEEAQNFSSIPLEELRKALGAPVGPSSSPLLSVAAALEAITQTVYEDAVQEHESMLLSGSKKAKEGRLSCQQVQFGLRRKRFAHLFTADTPTNSVAISFRKVCDAFLDASTASMLKGVEPAADAAAVKDELENSSSAVGEVTEPGSDGKENEAWAKRKDNIVTERDLAWMLKLVNPAFSLANDAMVMLVALHRDLIRAMRELDIFAAPRATTENGINAAAEALGWIPSSCYVRVAELSDILVGASTSAPSYLPPAVSLRVKIIRGTGAVAHSTVISIPRVDPLNEHLNAACKTMFVDRKDIVFLFGWSVIEASSTPNDLCFLPKCSIFGVTKSWWDNARREEARRGILTAGGKGMESSLKALKSNAVSRVAEEMKIISSASKPAPAPAPEASKVTEGATDKKKQAILARLNKRPPPTGAEESEGKHEEASSAAPYHPVVASATTRLPILSPTKVAALTSKIAPAKPHASTLGAAGASVIDNAAARQHARTRLIKTPAVGARSGDVKHLLAKLPAAATRSDFGQRFKTMPAPVRHELLHPDPPIATPTRKAPPQQRSKPESDVSSPASRRSSVQHNKSPYEAKVSPPKPHRGSGGDRISKVARTSPAADDSTLFTDLQMRLSRGKQKDDMPASIPESTIPSRKVATTIGTLQIPSRTAKSLLQKSEDTMKPLQSAMATITALAGHLSGVVPTQDAAAAEGAGTTEVNLRHIKDALMTAQESTKALLTMVCDIERQSRKKPEESEGKKSESKEAEHVPSAMPTIAEPPAKQAADKLQYPHRTIKTVGKVAVPKQKANTSAATRPARATASPVPPESARASVASRTESAMSDVVDGSVAHVEALPTESSSVAAHIEVEAHSEAALDQSTAAEAPTNSVADVQGSSYVNDFDI
jgi:hypothetical protein